MNATSEPTQIWLAAYPSGATRAQTWVFAHDSLPDLAKGDVYVRLSQYGDTDAVRGENHGKLMLALREGA